MARLLEIAVLGCLVVTVSRCGPGISQLNSDPNRSLSGKESCGTTTIGAHCVGNLSGYIYAGTCNGYPYITTPADSGEFRWDTRNTAEILDLAGSSDTNYGLNNLRAIQAHFGATFATVAAAANNCSTLGEGWYLPANFELYWLYTYKTEIGGFITFTDYWSSTESFVNAAYGMSFATGVFGLHTMTDSRPVRCVRRLDP